MRGGIGAGPGLAGTSREDDVSSTVPIPEERRLVPRREPEPAEEPEPGLSLAEYLRTKDKLIAFAEQLAPEVQSLRDENQTLKARCDELQEMLVTATERLDTAENQAAMAEGQFAQMWQALRTMDANQQAFNARMAAIAQQVVRNSRKDALDAACRSRQPGEGPDKVLRHADSYVTWLEPPAPPPGQPVQEPETEDADGRPHPTSH